MGHAQPYLTRHIADSLNTDEARIVMRSRVYIAVLGEFTYVYRALQELGQCIFWLSLVIATSFGVHQLIQGFLGALYVHIRKLMLQNYFTPRAQRTQ